MSFPRGKELVIQTTEICDFLNAAGKIIRRELRDWGKEELAGNDPHDDHVNAKVWERPRFLSYTSFFCKKYGRRMSHTMIRIIPLSIQAMFSRANIQLEH